MITAITDRGTMTTSWQHQREALAFVKDKPGSMLAMEMGTGKTKVAIDLMDAQDYRRVLNICPLSVVSGVWPGEFARHSPAPWTVLPLAHGSVKDKQAQAEAALLKSERAAVVINYESVWREPFASWAKKQPWDLVVLDECHPAGTAIATPAGKKRIEKLKRGDVVWGVDHSTGQVVQSRVRHTFTRTSREGLIALGDTLMTPDHPVWTSRGYIPAREVTTDDTVGCIAEKDQEENPPPDLRMVRHELFGRQDCSPVLRPFVLWQSKDEHARGEGAQPDDDVAFASTPRRPGSAPSPFAVRLQPTPKPQEPSQGPGYLAANGVSNAQGRQRARVDRSATDIGRPVGMAGRVPHWSESSPARLAVGLQTGPGRAGAEGGHRSGRAFSHGAQGEGSRCPEETLPRVPWLDGPSLLEQTDIGRPAGGHQPNSEGCTVFNIETETGNYFAEGLLVHNSHRIKSPGGVASRYCSRLSDRVPQRLALTGTPMAHSPLDIYAQYRALDKSIYGTSYFRFKSRYAVMGGWNNQEIMGYQHQEEFQEKLYSIAYRVEAADVLDLPPLLTVTRMCELGPKARKLYRTLERDFIADLEEGRITAVNALSQLLRLQQVTSGYARTEDDRDVEVDTTKAELLADLLEDMGKEPVVVFARFKHDLEVVHRVARKLGRPSYEISGARKELSLWNEWGGVLAVQIQSGGLGIDLAKARYAVYYSLGFSLGDYLQSRARLHRPGQKRPVEIIHLIAAHTVDEKVMAALAAREQVVESIMRRGLK